MDNGAKHGDMKKSLATLKDYMDIREIYLYIKSNKLLSELNKRVIELDCGFIVNDMLYLTERLYGSFCERNESITCEQSIKHDYNSELLISFFERRLFYPILEGKLHKKYEDEPRVTQQLDK